MPVDNISKATVSQIVLASRGDRKLHDFSKVLNDTVSGEKEVQVLADHTEKSELKGADKRSYIELGRISKEKPTVSHILKSNPDYSEKCWDIIFSSENRGKLFTAMREGTVVGLKSDSNELVWGRELSRLIETADIKMPGADGQDAAAKGSEEELIKIGTLSKENPTVSHLFQADSDYADSTWNIIHARINRNKQYNSLQTGTQVLLNTKTKEITFRNDTSSKSIVRMETVKQEEQSLMQTVNQQESLAEAVKPYIGIPYSKIDCYGLIVRGLQNQGIQYKGEGGIREKLEMMAESNGLPRNAYFNGEGLVEKAGTKVFSKSMNVIRDAKGKTEEIYSEMKPYLRKGFILSFSTSSKGHTGVISRQGGEWTYINSGVIDNHISSKKISKGVGEEYLKAELNNWLALASHNKEPLTVTIGHVGRNGPLDFQG